MPNPDRLSGLDASFLSLERSGAHMHVGSVLLFDGEAPPYEDLVAAIEQRLHLVPRYRQKLAYPPFVQSRPVWIDDPHFNAGYHVRHTALPAPGGEEALRRLAGRVFAQGLDRSKPLWELWLVDKVGEDSFAIVSKTHHALVDGVSGVDISTVLFDLEADPPEPAPAPPWFPRPEPSGAALLSASLAESAAAPVHAARGAIGSARHPERAGRAVGGLAAMARAGVSGAPPSPLNVRIGPHRRFAWVDADLSEFKAIKAALGGTVNDVVLTAVAGALRAFVIRRGRDPEGLELKAMVPVSIRAEAERGALGNRVAAMYAPLPVYEPDAAQRFRIVHDAMGDLKGSGQAVGAEVLTRLDRLRGAHDPRPGGPAADPPALLQPRRHERPRPAVPPLPDGPPDAALLSAGPAHAQHGAGDRDHVLRRPARLRPARRLRRAARARRRRARPRGVDRGAAQVAGVAKTGAKRRPGEPAQGRGRGEDRP